MKDMYSMFLKMEKGEDASSAAAGAMTDAEQTTDYNDED